MKKIFVKELMIPISNYVTVKKTDTLVDVLQAKQEGINPWESWQEKLPSSYFERRWGAAWKDNDQNFWDTFQASLKTRKKTQ